MQYQFAVGNTVEVPINFTLKDGKEQKTFKFNLICERMDADEVSAALAEKDKAIKDVLSEVVKGWEGQKLILDAEKNPADFSEDAFAVMMKVTGLPVVVLNAYLKEIGAKAKN